MNISVPRCLGYVVSACLLLLATGCASSKPESMDGLLYAAPKVNPDSTGRASPVVLKVFHLKSLASFQTSDFFSLYDRPTEALGSDYVTVEEIVLTPGSKQRIERPIGPDTRYLAFVAAFRDLEHSQWRGTLDISKGDKKVPLSVELTDNKLTVRAAGSERELQDWSEKLQAKLAEKRDEVIQNAEEDAKQNVKDKAQQAISKRIKRLP
ncbi:type VI secretion system lipoprotein TssJ [Chitinimonas sp.]|uniref:type VI secretion system lipoprotein TssJ n=1 Tax=Chitinimonas sp. TaxID=1934313 RepID=UPI002F91DC88